MKCILDVTLKMLGDNHLPPQSVKLQQELYYCNRQVLYKESQKWLVKKKEKKDTYRQRYTFESLHRKCEFAVVCIDARNTNMCFTIPNLTTGGAVNNCDSPLTLAEDVN